MHAQSGGRQGPRSTTTPSPRASCPLFLTIKTLSIATNKHIHQQPQGGDAIDVFRYMAKFGLPDESCLHYAASDWTAFRSKRMKKCPAAKHCVNCMPKPTKEDPDAFECWPIKRPVLYTVSRRRARAPALCDEKVLQRMRCAPPFSSPPRPFTNTTTYNDQHYKRNQTLYSSPPMASSTAPTRPA